MEKLFTLLLFMLSIVVLSAQSINLEEVVLETPIADARNGSVALGDIDNDGDADLIVSGKEDGVRKSTLYKNDGTGKFMEVPGTPFVAVEFGANGFADVDRDGDQDLLITGRANSLTQVYANLYLNDGAGNFSLDVSTPFEPTLEGDFAFADVDRDGDQDLLLSGYKGGGSSEGHTTLYRNNGFGSFTEDLAAGFSPLKSSSLVFFDMDNDSDLDVLMAGLDEDDVPQTELYANDGSGGFTLIDNTSIIGFSTGDATVADMDGDGDQDVLVCGQMADFSNMSRLYTNDGTGGFSLVSDTPFPATFIGTVDVADFDRDGDEDVLVTGAIQGSTFAGDIYENRGGNTFVLSSSLVQVYLSSVAIYDIDGDGYQDAVIAGISNGVGAFNTRTYRNTAGALPVDLTKFGATPMNNKAVGLTWQTSSETNNDYFAIEHSLDGFSFQEIGKVDGKGTLVETQNYSFTHEGVRAGWHYYRLKQTDYDGGFEYSEIVSVRMSEHENDSVVMPNPTTGPLAILIPSEAEEQMEVQLLNTHGQVLRSISSVGDSGRLEIDLSDLPNGIYYLSYWLEQERLVEKIMKL